MLKDNFIRIQMASLCSITINDWLEFIVSRLGKQPWLSTTLWKAVLNDRVFDTIEKFHGKPELVALGRFFEQPNNQLCILNQRLIDECLFKEYIIIK